VKWRYYDSNPEGTCASLGISTSPIFSSERSLKISSAFANISSSLAALGSVAARAASRERTFSDKDMGLSPTLSLGGMELGDCFIMLSLENLRSKSVIAMLRQSSFVGLTWMGIRERILRLGSSPTDQIIETISIMLRETPH